jgi:hypothetical protein
MRAKKTDLGSFNARNMLARRRPVKDGFSMKKGDLFFYTDDWRREWTCMFLCRHTDNEYKDWVWIFVFAVKQKWMVHEEQLRTFSVLDVSGQ